uniref:PLD phosphodiesterase domain-containing protein n=1 Tax=Caenorhabditis japonica TaxID=281687 RepID=A0A8R1DI97_CAEJA
MTYPRRIAGKPLMKRANETSSLSVPSKKTGAIEDSVPILEQGKIYFTPIGGITVPRQESEGALGLNEVISAIRPIDSLHLSFLLDFQFLISCYPSQLKDKPITLVVGEKDAKKLRQNSYTYPNVEVLGAPLPIPYGVHHTKMGIFESEDGKVHVIVSTANLTTDDWEFKTQQFYYAVGNKMESEDVTPTSLFQADLIVYFGQYRFLLEKWRNLIKRTDFTAVADRLVFSTPGNHFGVPVERLGHPRLKNLLKEVFPTVEPMLPLERCTFIAQCSSIGSLGPQPINWFRGEFLKSLEANNPSPANRPAKFHFIFPCVEDVRNSCQGYMSGGSISYRSSVHKRQAWLQVWMCKWRSYRKRRTLAMPHCKTYVKFDHKIPQWQLLTSANLSKAAWGELTVN